MIFHNFIKYLVLCVSQCIGYNYHALIQKDMNRLGVQRVNL